MNLLDLLKPATLQAIATLFIIGFVFRHVEGRVRGRRKEGDLHATVLAVAWSLVLFSIFQAVQRPIFSTIPKSLHPAVSLASYISAAAVLGYFWGRSHISLAREFPLVLPSGHAQTVVSTIERSKNAYVEVLVDDIWYQGMVWHYDRDPERYLDLHFTLRHPAILKEDAWVPLDQVDEVMLSLKDVKVMNRLKIAPLGENSDGGQTATTQFET